jgi:galactose mutarotase-like enzyme
LTATTTLSAGDATLRVRDRGAEPVSWRIGGRELLWSGGDAWPRSSPVLFPIVGRAKEGHIRVGGQAYPIGVHGFAASETFAVASGPDSAATFTLHDNPTTRSHYPFAFRLEVSYRLGPREVSASFKVTNAGETAMPFAIGFHPGFLWPFAATRADGHAILFEREERALVPVIDRDGLFTTSLRSIPLEGRRLPLSHDLLAQEALCFLDANSRGLRFVSPSGEAIAVEMDDFPHVALWSRSRASFLCIECWTGHGDPQGFAGELADKPSMRVLAPGDSSTHAVRWRFEERAT